MALDFSDDVRKMRHMDTSTSQPSPSTVPGYVVTVGAPGQPAYTLTGKRGAVYSLLRQRSNPHLMYVVNIYGVVTALQGNGTWTDRDGELRPWYAGQ